jgi:hypothetical protein
LQNPPLPSFSSLTEEDAQGEIANGVLTLRGEKSGMTEFFLGALLGASSGRFRWMAYVPAIL